MKNALKTFVSQLAYYGGVTRVLRRHFSGVGIVVMLHEIHENTESELMTGCSVDSLERLVHWLRDMGWNIVSIDEALRRETEPAIRPFAVLTFDDGYRDNLDRALPVLDRLDAPFTVYVPTQAITRDLYAWWLGLRHLFLSHDVVFVSAMGRKFECSDRAAKITALKAATTWIGRDFNRTAALKETFADYGICLEGLVDRYFLNEDSLRSMARHPLVTIGAHSTSHVALTTIGDEDLRHEMVDNREFLQDIIEEEVAHFAYPYGACDSREFALAKEIGYSSAVTTRDRPVYRDDLRIPHALPRVEFASSYNLAQFDVHASGAFHLAKTILR